MVIGLIFKELRSMCEEALLKVKGVISFTFQMASKRCTVRIRSDLPTEVTKRFIYLKLTSKYLE